MKLSLVWCICCSLLAIVFGCTPTDNSTNKVSTKFYVEGVIHDRPTGNLYLTTKQYSRQIAPDTLAKAILNNGFFSFEGEIQGPVLVDLVLEGSNRKNSFVLENTKQYLDLFWRESMMYSGGKYHHRVMDFQHIDKKYQRLYKRNEGDKFDQLATYFELLKAKQSPRDRVRKLQKAGISLRKELFQRKKELLDSILKSDTDPTIKGLLLIRNSSVYNNYVWAYKDLTEETINRLNQMENRGALATLLTNMLNERKEFYKREAKYNNSNTHFDPIALRDMKDRLISLSDVLKKNKYVFVDFWASWCGPCRIEFPFIQKAYTRYKDKGFEVFGISVDENKKAWITASEEEGIEWLNVIVPKDKINEVRLQYNVELVPSSFLLDKQGKIIARDLRREELYKKLDKLFNQ